MSQDSGLLPISQAERPIFAGVDLGGTNIKVGLVDDRGRSLHYASLPTETWRGPEDGVRRMAAAVHAAAAELGLPLEEIARIGLGSPGTMDVPAGMLLQPHNLPGWYNFPIRERLAHHARREVTFANDANAAAYGEFWVGSGREMSSMVLFTLGTGVGCGIIIDDLVIEGEHSHGAECGHIIIDPSDDARVCPCGQPGHLEAYASATAVIRRTEEALQAGRRSSLAARIAAGEELTPILIGEEAEKGDELALETVLETARYLGIGAVTLLHTIDPVGVVIGGAMTFGQDEMPLGRRFLARVREEIARRAFPVIAEHLNLHYARLGGDAGYIGAAGMARLEHRRRQARPTPTRIP